MADYEIPETHEFPVIPSVMEGAMAHSYLLLPVKNSSPTWVFRSLKSPAS